jgi:hypothetical protein
MIRGAHASADEHDRAKQLHERSCRLGHWRLRSSKRTTGHRSDALEDFRASHSDRAAIRAGIRRDPSRDNCRRANEASGSDRRYSAVWRPIPRCLEHDHWTLNPSHRVIGNSRTRTRRAADENSGEISRRVHRQNLHQRAPLTLPNSRYQALSRRRGSGYEKKKRGGGDAVHILLQGSGDRSRLKRDDQNQGREPNPRDEAWP